MQTDCACNQPHNNMKTYIENYAATIKSQRRNRKRHTRAKTFALRVIYSLAIAGLIMTLCTK